MKIVWVHPHCNNINVGSYRLQTLQPHKHLLSLGYDSQVVDHIDKATTMHPDVIICMQINDAAPATNYKFGVNKNVKVIAFQSDGPITSPEVLDNCDWVVVDGDIVKVRNPVRFIFKTTHIPTALEIDTTKFKPHNYPGTDLKLVYLGAQGNLHFAEPVLSHLKSRYSVTVLSDHPQADIKWDIDTYADELNKFDVGIVPYPPYLIVEDAKSFSGYFYKDPSRPSLLQAIGLPVIVSPLPSYLTYIQHGVNGLIANTLDEWVMCVTSLQQDKEMYERIAFNGRIAASLSSASSCVGALWESVLKEVCHVK